MSKNKHKMMLISLLFILAIMAVPFSVFCADGQIKIGQTSSTTFPITITSSGSYVLTSDLNVSSTTANAITIEANNVTVDLNGHAIIGPGSGSGRGISASLSTYNITVMNGTVRDFGVYGVMISGRTNIVKDMRVHNSGDDGFQISRAVITNCAATENGNRGFSVERSTLTDCMAYLNSQSGIIASASTVTDCNANKNITVGIDAIEGSTVTNCTAYDNTGDGIDADESIITNCTVTNNGGDGIEGKNKNRIEGNNLRDNGGYGLYLSGDKNYAIKNTASDNTTGQFNDGGSNNHMPTSGDNANWNP
jgi:parallel beta-helix repeat protein